MLQPTNTDVQTADVRILDAAKKFAISVGKSTQFIKYEQANECLAKDNAAKQILSEYQQAQQLLQMTRSWGGTSPTDMKHFEELREKLFSNQTLKDYFKSQEDLVAMLKELNEFISEKIGVNFANLTKPAGGCC